MNDFARWIVQPRPQPGATLRLLCIPFAGAGTGVYHGWADLLPPSVELWLLRAPGRETRLREPPCADLCQLAAAAAAAVAPEMTGPLAVFGHSLGAAIGFELARRLRRDHDTRLAHLIVSGLPAPHLPQPSALAGLPAGELLDALSGRYQQIPPELREDPEIQQMYLPILRADLMMYERYRCQPEEPLDCSITAIGGLADASCPVEVLAAWRVHTARGFSLTTLQGGHFNLNTADERLRMINSIMATLSQAGVS
jgi:medium-chain acyl-[acyl-carrier-protein] hydrolase